MYQAITNLEKKFTIFNRSLTDSLLSDLVEMIDRFNDNQKPTFTFTQEFKVDICLIICGYAARKFKEWTNKSLKYTNIIVALQLQKPKYFAIFKNKFMKVTAEIAAANVLTDSLVASITKKFVEQEHIPMEIVEHFISHHSYINTKNGIKIVALTDLANKEQFQNYQLYIDDTTIFFKWWIFRFVKEHCEFTTSSPESIFTTIVSNETQKMILLIKNAVNVSDTCNSLSYMA